MALLKRYSAPNRSTATPPSLQGQLPDAFRLLVNNQNAAVVGLKCVTFWREASAGPASSSSVKRLPAATAAAKSVPSHPPFVAPAAIAPKLAATGVMQKKPPPWLKYQGLVLAPELSARLATLPLASGQQIIAACDAAMEAAAVLSRHNAAAAAAAAGGGGYGDDDDGSGWSEVRRPGARRVSGGGGGGGRLDASVLIKCLARTLMKVR